MVTELFNEYQTRKYYKSIRYRWPWFKDQIAGKGWGLGNATAVYMTIAQHRPVEVGASGGRTLVPDVLAKTSDCKPWICSYEATSSTSFSWFCTHDFSFPHQGESPCNSGKYINTNSKSKVKGDANAGAAASATSNGSTHISIGMNTDVSAGSSTNTTTGTSTRVKTNTDGNTNSKH